MPQANNTSFSHSLSKNSAALLLKGVVYMLLGFFFFSIGNALVKATSGHYTILQILCIRNVTILIPLAFYIFYIQKKYPPSIIFKTQHLKTHILRGFIVVVSLWGIFSGFQLLPLGNATAIGFSQILFMTIISIPFLREKVTFSQWIAIFIGFGGVLIIVRPSLSIFSLDDRGTLCMLLGVFLDAIVLLYPRKLGKSDSVLTILFYYALFSSLIALAVLPLEGWGSITSQKDLFLLIGIGILSLLGQGCVTQAFQYASAGILSPMIYSTLLWGIVFGYLFWNEIPDLCTLLGAALVMASGVYVIHRSQSQAKLVEEIPLSPEGGKP